MADLDTLKKRVRAIERTNVETLDLGPVENGKLLYQDKVDYINRVLRNTVNRLGKRKESYLQLKQSESVTESINHVSNGNPAAFTKLSNEHPEVLQLLITNENAAAKLADLINRLAAAGANDEMQGEVLSKAFDAIATPKKETTPENQE